MPFTAEQLAERRNFLGASECSAALGLSPFFSPVELFLAKIGNGQPIEETLPMLVGQALEPVVLTLAERDLGEPIILRQQVFVDESTPWRRCTIDGWLDSQSAIIEAKTSGDNRGWGDGDDDIPAHYFYNAQHSLACIPEAKRVIFPVLIGGRTFRVYRVERDAEAIELVKTGENLFMDRVREGVPPEPVSVEDVERLYPRSSGQVVVATPEVESAAMAIAIAKAQIKALEQKIEAQKLTVTAFMRDAQELARISLTGAQGAILATWNSQERRTIDAQYLRAHYPQIALAATKVSTHRVYLNKVKL
jgi:putative phage-type endonuclease